MRIANRRPDTIFDDPQYALALNVAVGVGEGDLLDTKRSQRAFSMPQAKRYQQKIWFAWWIGVFVCGIMFTVGCKKVYITEAEVHQRIKSEIPPGSTYSQVNDFLKKNDWGPDRKLLEFEDFGTHDDMLKAEEKQRIRWTSSGGIRTIEKDLLWAWGIVIKFYYDQDEKVVTYNLVKYRY